MHKLNKKEWKGRKLLTDNNNIRLTDGDARNNKLFLPAVPSDVTKEEIKQFIEGYIGTGSVGYVGLSSKKDRKCCSMLYFRFL